jgi:uncharacterized protein (DUF302 family)
MKSLLFALLASTASLTAAGNAEPARADRASAQAVAAPPAADEGVIRVKSAYGVDEAVARIKADVAQKGIKFFDEIDQAKLAAGAGINLNRSTLVVFGNPPLGIQFLTANPYAGLDWPVRMLVFQDNSGQVWIAYSDFTFIAHRHHITDRDAQFAMATMVAASIAQSAQAK